MLYTNPLLLSTVCLLLGMFLGCCLAALAVMIWLDLRSSDEVHTDEEMHLMAAYYGEE